MIAEYTSSLVTDADRVFELWCGQIERQTNKQTEANIYSRRTVYCFIVC